MRKAYSPILEISLKTPTVPSTGFCISAWCLIDAFDQTGEKSSSTSHAGARMNCPLQIISHKGSPDICGGIHLTITCAILNFSLQFVNFF